jgi:UDPglucose 6-dehydrogenase
VKIAVIGTGYVGLVAGAGFADFGNDVTCVDIDAERIALLQAGRVPFHEPGLVDLVQRNAGQGRLQFTTSIAEAMPGTDVVVLAIGTPQQAEGDGADLRALFAAARDVGKALTDWAVVVIKSTVPVGTAYRVRDEIAAVTKQRFAVASNPEFLKEGDAVNDFMKPARIILGTDDDRATRVLEDLYAPFVRTSDRIHLMDIPSAELAKYAANGLLATRISFMNELAILAERLGADIEAVRAGVGADPRIGNKFLFAGVGFGGSCFPKDLRALRQTARDAGIALSVVDAVDLANERQKRVMGERIAAHFAGDLSGKKVAVWGLAFKPETDDIREAPALVLIDQLLRGGARISVYDPVAADNVAAVLGDAVERAPDMYQAAAGADALALVTEWKMFRRPNFRRLRDTMRGPALFDGRNVWNPRAVRELGFSYYGIGRPSL